MSDWYEAEQRVQRARALFEQHQWEQALVELREAVALNPYNSGWLFNIGLTLDELGRFDEAIQAYRDCLQIDEANILAMNHLAVDMCRIGRYQQSLKVFEQIQQIDPSFEPAYCNRITVYTEMGDHARAEEMFYLARLYKDRCPHCYYSIGTSLFQRGLYDRAIYCWQQVIDDEPSHFPAYVRLAEAYWKKGELESARRHYLFALQHDSGNIELILALGRLLTQSDSHREAGEKFRLAVELAPDHPSTNYCLGRWLFHEGRMDQAMAAFQRVLQLDPTYPAAHLRLAEIAYAQQDIEAARMHLRGELTLRPQDVQLLSELSELLARCGDQRAAIACLRRVVQLEPSRWRAWQNLGVLLCQLGRLDEGVHCYRRALRGHREDPSLLFNLALGYLLLRNYRRARTIVRRGLRIAPGDRSLQNLSLRIRVSKLVHRFRALVRRSSPVHRVGRVLCAWRCRRRAGR